MKRYLNTKLGVNLIIGAIGVLMIYGVLVGLQFLASLI